MAAEGWRVETFAEIDSTSEEAKRRAFAGDPGRLWIVAGRQTAGRGRHGRSWRSPEGNFYGSALLIAPCAPADAPQLGFVAGLATQGAIADFGAREARLKWPNDLVADGAKLAGLLLEAWSLSPTRFAVAVGIGVNLAHHPTDLAYPATDLAALLGRRVEPAAFLARLSLRFEEELALWARGQNFAEVRARWLGVAAGLGGPIRATTSTGAREGVFEGLDARGRLLLRTQTAIETVESADVALLGAGAGPKPAT